MPSEFPLFEIPLRRWTTKEPSPPVDLAMLRNIVFDYDYSYVPMEQLYTVVALYYLTLTTLWGFVQRSIERRFGEPSQQLPQNAGIVASMWKSLKLRQRSAR